MNFRSCIRLLAFLCVAAVGSFHANQANAVEEDCPAWALPDAPLLENGYQYRSRVTGEPVNPGPPFTEKAYYWTGGVWFEMPLGYRNPWPVIPSLFTDKDEYRGLLASFSLVTGFDPNTGEFNPALLKRERDELSKFAFWMPSLRYVERDRAPTLTRPCEAGRPPPTEAEYTVSFSIQWPFLPDSADSPPARRFKLAQERLDNGQPLTGQYFAEPKYNLDRRVSGEQDYFIYRDDGDLAAGFHCTERSGNEPGLQPLCAGYVWQRSKDLILSVSFPIDRGQGGTQELWREPVEAAIGLAEQWKSDL